ncbi:hypothetical protein ALC53_12618 [Atta colombica]|uniref:Double jelly roll-like domain-containing protein n=1 Tax=Atta colombica TaxID=520822 RepID=A0A151HYT6_9HYME|nr:hypothetical protein ALC53_12618 [Atta colombica]
MTDILNIGNESIFDDRIVKFEFHTYNWYVNTSFGHSDEIRIPILYCILGFCEDYKRVIINARYELILIRTRNDNNYIVRNPATDPLIKKNIMTARLDCLRQNESVKIGIVDVRLEFEFKENVSTNTIGYCLIIHDRVIEAQCPT